MLDKILDVFNYIFWFFILNLFFMLFNIPIIMFFMTLGISKLFDYFPLFILCLLPTMPTFTALLHCMNKLRINKGLSLIKDFKNGIKLNFMQALSIWFGFLLLFLMLHTNMRFFASKGYGLVLVIFSISIAIVLFATIPYVFMLISRFKMSNLEIIKTSLILCFTKPSLTITNLLLLTVSLIIFEISPGTTMLFISSILAFLLTLVNKKLFSELENLSRE